MCIINVFYLCEQSCKSVDTICELHYVLTRSSTDVIVHFFLDFQAQTPGLALWHKKKFMVQSRFSTFAPFHSNGLPCCLGQFPQERVFRGRLKQLQILHGEDINLLVDYRDLRLHTLRTCYNLNLKSVLNFSSYERDSICSLRWFWTPVCDVRHWYLHGV